MPSFIDFFYLNKIKKLLGKLRVTVLLNPYSDDSYTDSMNSMGLFMLN